MSGLYAGIGADNSVKLTWQTSSESDLLGYHVWRSNARVDGYERVSNSLIPATGNCSCLTEYSFEDHNLPRNNILWYKVEALSLDGSSSFFGPIDVDMTALWPDRFNLERNYPNPFNGSTVINYSLAETGRVRLRIYDLRGRIVRTLIDEMSQAGNYQAVWDGRDQAAGSLASGTYIYRLDQGNNYIIRKMVLLQ